MKTDWNVWEEGFLLSTPIFSVRDKNDGVICTLPQSTMKEIEEKRKVAYLISFVPEMRQALIRAERWLGRAIVENVHVDCAAPQDLPTTLMLIREILNEVGRDEYDTPRNHFFEVFPDGTLIYLGGHDIEDGVDNVLSMYKTHGITNRIWCVRGISVQQTEATMPFESTLFEVSTYQAKQRLKLVDKYDDVVVYEPIGGALDYAVQCAVKLFDTQKFFRFKKRIRLLFSKGDAYVITVSDNEVEKRIGG